MNADLLPDEPSDLETEPIEPKDANDIDFEDMPSTDDLAGDSDDDSRWEAFVSDEDERDPEPDLDDLWSENVRKDKETTGRGHKVKADSIIFLLVSNSPCLLV